MNVFGRYIDNSLEITLNAIAFRGMVQSIIGQKRKRWAATQKFRVMTYIYSPPIVSPTSYLTACTIPQPTTGGGGISITHK